MARRWLTDGSAVTPRWLANGSAVAPRWLADGSESIIESFDAETFIFKLREARELKTGDEFMIYTTVSAPWNIHDNIFDDCGRAMNLDTDVGARAIVRDNIIN